MKYIAAAVIPVFLVGWVLSPQDKFGYILGVVMVTAVYLFVDWLGMTGPTYRGDTPNVIRSLPPGMQLYSPSGMNRLPSGGTYITEQEIEALGRLLTFTDIVSEHGHRDKHGMIGISVRTWDDMAVEYRDALARFSDDSVPIAKALKNSHRG